MFNKLKEFLNKRKLESIRKKIDAYISFYGGSGNFREHFKKKFIQYIKVFIPDYVTISNHSFFTHIPYELDFNFFKNDDGNYEVGITLSVFSSLVRMVQGVFLFRKKILITPEVFNDMNNIIQGSMISLSWVNINKFNYLIKILQSIHSVLAQNGQLSINTFLQVTKYMNFDELDEEPYFLTNRGHLYRPYTVSQIISWGGDINIIETAWCKGLVNNKFRFFDNSEPMELRLFNRGDIKKCYFDVENHTHGELYFKYNDYFMSQQCPIIFEREIVYKSRVNKGLRKLQYINNEKILYEKISDNQKIFNELWENIFTLNREPSISLKELTNIELTNILEKIIVEEDILSNEDKAKNFIQAILMLLIKNESNLNHGRVYIHKLSYIINSLFSSDNIYLKPSLLRYFDYDNDTLPGIILSAIVHLNRSNSACLTSLQDPLVLCMVFYIYTLRFTKWESLRNDISPLFFSLLVEKFDYCRLQYNISSENYRYIANMLALTLGNLINLHMFELYDINTKYSERFKFVNELANKLTDGLKRSVYESRTFNCTHMLNNLIMIMDMHIHTQTSISSHGYMDDDMFCFPFSNKIIYSSEYYNYQLMKYWYMDFSDREDIDFQYMNNTLFNQLVLESNWNVDELINKYKDGVIC